MYAVECECWELVYLTVFIWNIVQYNLWKKALPNGILKEHHWTCLLPPLALSFSSMVAWIDARLVFEVYNLLWLMVLTWIATETAVIGVLAALKRFSTVRKKFYLKSKRRKEELTWKTLIIVFIIFTIASSSSAVLSYVLDSVAYASIYMLGFFIVGCWSVFKMKRFVTFLSEFHMAESSSSASSAGSGGTTGGEQQLGKYAKMARDIGLML
eukprot:TRINITY_DN8655_c0_g1_i1.p1 TRINITY_DN8655_c0_g1~~TRINITY_DN8655_c0_g1_i1.p1  ORF type:complete len:212 (-),score=44.12 TRINITY_DN8655_c0_g1_i1:751-1386(-)